VKEGKPAFLAGMEFWNSTMTIVEEFEQSYVMMKHEHSWMCFI
jgi:hypothetical protein